MTKLYTRLPDNMQGHYLMPLNELKKEYPLIAAEHAKKYEWRPFVMNIKIPALNCIWNDVIFLSPVHPAKIKDLHIQQGHSWTKKLRFAEVDPSHLDSKNALIWPYIEEEFDVLTNVKPFTEKNLEAYDYIPKKTEKYYAQCKKANERPLAWRYIPHVLYKGKIDIRKEKIITV